MSAWNASGGNASGNWSGEDYESDYEAYAGWTVRSLWPSDAKTAAIAGAFLATGGFACAGNALVIATLVQQRHMRTVTNTLLLNQSLVDLLHVLSCMPVTLIGQLMQNFIFPAFVCPVALFAQGLVVAVSAFTLTVLSWERFAAICRPLSSRRWQTMKHTYQCIVGVWVLAALLASPIAVHAQVEEWRPGRRKCYENWASAELEIAYALALDVLLFGVPLVVMGLAYSLIAVHLTRSLRFASNMPSATVTSGGSAGGERRSPASSFGSRAGYLVTSASVSASVGEAKQGAEHVVALEAREALAPERHPSVQCRTRARRITPVAAAQPLIALTPPHTAPHSLPVPAAANNTAAAGSLAIGGAAAETLLPDTLREAPPNPKLLSRTRRDRASLASPVSERPSIYLANGGRRGTATANGRQSYLQAFVANRRKVIRMIIVVIVEFFVSWSPTYTLQTWYTVDPVSARYWVPSEARIILVLLGYSSAACHPITYCFMNRNFRDGFLRVFHLRSNTLNGVARTQNGGGSTAASRFGSPAIVSAANGGGSLVSGAGGFQRLSQCGSFIAHASSTAAARTSARFSRAQTPVCSKRSLTGSRSATGTCQSSFVSSHSHSTRSTVSCTYSGSRSISSRRDLTNRQRAESFNTRPSDTLSPDCAA